MQIGFDPCIRGIDVVVWWKTPDVENLVTGFLITKGHGLPSQADQGANVAGGQHGQQQLFKEAL
jgi:hypothetical protein